MCMQDVQIARSTNSRIGMVTVPAGATATIAISDPTRYSLVIGQPSSDSVRIAPAGLATATAGINLLATTDKPLVMPLAAFGMSLLGRWEAFNTGAGDVTILVIDTLLEAQTAQQLPPPDPRSRSLK